MTDRQPRKTKEIELHPDAWKRFEAGIGAIGKAAATHRPQSRKKAAAARPARKRGARQQKP
jgi:hypothetical protein